MINALKQWDRATTYVLLMAFGAYSTVYPIVSFERVAPHWAELLLGGEFFTAGLLLLIAINDHKAYRMAGLLVISAGLLTISGAIALVGNPRALGYAFLFGAFAMSSVHDIRVERRKHKQDKEDELELAAEIVSLVYGAREHS